MNVRTLCLGILSFSSMTGYDIRKLAAEGNFSHFCEASYGSIYPALSQLTTEGLVVFVDEALDGKPARKIYSITEKGSEALCKTIEIAPEPDRFKSEFLFYSLFADKMEPADFTRLLKLKIGNITEKLEGLQRAGEKCTHEPSSFAIGYGIAMNEAILTYLNNYLQSLEGKVLYKTNNNGIAEASTASELKNE